MAPEERCMKMAYTNIKSSVEENRFSIKENKKSIHQNKQEIRDLKNKTVPLDVFEGTMARYEQMNFRLSIILIIITSWLIISNVVWMYMWNTYDNAATTVINKDGVSNFIGRDGTVENGGNG